LRRAIVLAYDLQLGDSRTSNPMPGKKSKPKKKTGSGAGASTQSAPRRSLDSLAQDIDDAYGWDTVALLICDAFALPGMSLCHQAPTGR
jgi:hypothetical protein